MKVGITGTPGTGKTSVAASLDRDIISLKQFAKEKDLGDQKKEFEVDMAQLENELPNNYWIEGHLAHQLPLDYCIVLRTRPDILRARLEKRDYSEAKVNENVEAEAMDLILSEAASLKIYEIDTTDKEASDVAVEVEKAISMKKERKGIVDWTEYL